MNFLQNLPTRNNQVPEDEVRTSAELISGVLRLKPTMVIYTGGPDGTLVEDPEGDVVALLIPGAQVYMTGGRPSVGAISAKAPDHVRGGWVVSFPVEYLGKKETFFATGFIGDRSAEAEDGALGVACANGQGRNGALNNAGRAIAQAISAAQYGEVSSGAKVGKVNPAEFQPLLEQAAGFLRGLPGWTGLSITNFRKKFGENAQAERSASAAAEMARRAGL